MKMTTQERAHYDARAREEAWGYAESILRPWVEAAQAIGSDELTRVMEAALEKTQWEFFRALDEQKAAKKAP
ncbi:MAG: hypothetical protein WKF53_15590 [Rubrobacter sp.]